MSNFDKDRFDALLKLAEFKRGLRDVRRQFEWKFTATALVALAGLSVFPEKVTPWGATIAILIICIVQTLWIIWNQDRSETDRVEMYDYKDEAEEMLLGTRHFPTNDKLPFYKQQACWFEIGTAWLIGLFSIAVRWIS